MDSLDLMIKGLTENGFADKTYGVSFWLPIQLQYNQLLHKATQTDGGVSKKVSSKNILKAQLKQALNAIIHVLKGNYPDSYHSELRSWGFQKEKY